MLADVSNKINSLLEIKIKPTTLYTHNYEPIVSFSIKL